MSDRRQEGASATARILHRPLGGDEMPRFGGPVSMLRLATVDDCAGLDACFVGVPFDNTTSNRVGARFAPRQIRAESAMARPCNVATRTAPFEALSMADVGDAAINPYSPGDSLRIIEAHFDRIMAARCRPLSLGGDHIITLPILRAVAKAHGPVGMIHIGAHADLNDRMFGEAVAHGTWVRRAVEDGLLDCRRVVQVGLRGTGYSVADLDWPRERGFLLVPAEECWHKSLAPLMAEVRERLGAAPVYISFEIDGLDQADATGHGVTKRCGRGSWFGSERRRAKKGPRRLGGPWPLVCREEAIESRASRPPSPIPSE